MDTGIHCQGSGAGTIEQEAAGLRWEPLHLWTLGSRVPLGQVDLPPYWPVDLILPG